MRSHRLRPICPTHGKRKTLHMGPHARTATTAYVLPPPYALPHPGRGIPAFQRAVTHWFSPPTRSAVSVSPIWRLVWWSVSIGHRCATPSLGVYAPVYHSLGVWAPMGPSLSRSVRGLVVFSNDVLPPRQVQGPLLAPHWVQGLVVFGTDVPPLLSELLSYPPGTLSSTDLLITAEVQLRRNSLSG